jgi:tetratricopeptide (TPR) repeat protein
MDSPEWYSGSDHSGEVPDIIERVIARIDANTADSGDIDALRDALTIEDEVNWRGFLLSLIGIIHYDMDQPEPALRLLESAVATCKVYHPTFDQVLNVYCQACYTLGVLLCDAERYDEAIPYLLRCLPYVREVYDDAYIGEIYSILNVCMSWTQRPAEALAFAEAAAVARQGDCETLENLMVALASAGELDRAREIFQLFVSRCPNADNAQRVTEFARHNLGEESVVN